jgi:hypothetical protein
MQELEGAREGIEKLVVVKLFDALWQADPSDRVSAMKILY